MFQKILQWIREVWNRMIGQTNIKQALNVDISLSSEMVSALQEWSLMYENRAPWLSTEVKSLNLPAGIAGEIARAVTMEMAVEFNDTPRAAFLEQSFAASILPKLREQVEKGAAKGGLMMKPYVAGKRLAVDFVQADQFYPVAFDVDGDITACIFTDQREVGGKFYTRLELHQMIAGGCQILNRAYRSDNRDTLGVEVPLDTIADWAELEPEATITGIDKPLFAYFRYPLANNIDPNSPLGVSCYSRAVNLIEQADRLYSNLLWEFESGKRALYVDTLAFDKDTDGKPRLPDKRLYRTLNTSGNVEDDNLFEAWSPDFREASIISGLDALLKKIEYQCGLAYGTLSDPQVEAKTATEVTTTRQRTFATITDTRKALSAALDRLLYAMDVWATLANLAPRGAYTVNYDFDDSVIVDQEAQMAADRQTATMGAMPKYIFLMRNYSLDEATAKQWIAEATAEMPQESDLFGGAA